jgi:hypothetical protein
MKTILAGVGLVLSLAVTPAAAAQQDFTLENSTGYTIAQVFVSSAASNDWEEDVMGRDVLADGESVDISFPAAENACRFDLKVIYDDQEEAVWGGLDLCSISNVEIKYNRASGETSAVVD